MRAGDSRAGIAQVREAEHLPPQQAVERLCALVESRHAEVIQAAAKLLGEMGRMTAVTPLMDAYWRLDADGARLDKGCHSRGALVVALGTLGAAVSEPVIRRALSTVQIETVGFGREDTAPALRAAAAFALVQVDPRNAIHDLALLLFDHEPNLAVPFTERMFAKARTRIAAAQALAALGEPAGAALLAVKLQSRGEEVAEVLVECLESLAALNPPNRQALILPYLQSEDPYLAGSAATSLARHLGEDALDLLLEHAPHVPRDAMLPLVLAITGIRSGRTGAALTTFFNDSDPRVRKAAVEGAILYVDNEVRTRLQAVAESDPDPRIRSAAAAALE